MGTRLIKQERSRRVRHISGRVDVSGGTPSAAIGSGYTVSDTGAGVVTVNITRPGREILSVSAIVIESTAATGHYIKVSSKTEASAVVFNIFVADGTDGAPADNVGFYFDIAVRDVTN